MQLALPRGLGPVLSRESRKFGRATPFFGDGVGGWTVGGAGDAGWIRCRDKELEFAGFEIEAAYVIVHQIPVECNFG